MRFQIFLIKKEKQYSNDVFEFGCRARGRRSQSGRVFSHESQLLLWCGIPFDVFLEVSDGKKVEVLKAHQFVLALHSDVLEEKFRSSVKSKSTTSIHLQCEDIEVLKVLIKFCYNIIVPMYDKTLRFLIAVYKEAEKFNIAELQVWSYSLFVL